MDTNHETTAAGFAAPGTITKHCVSVIVLPSVIGAEWREGTTDHSVTRLHGADSVLYSWRSAGGTWVTTAIDQPERFGKLPTDPKTMRAYVAAFLGNKWKEVVA